ncbi:MAG: hypothetical protein OXU31_04290 [Gammaproteobacteria bacterium]|nr:hypothetical protein [Gammaproteobacteria bacterium]
MKTLTNHFHAAAVAILIACATLFVLAGCAGVNFGWDSARSIQLGDTKEVLAQKMGAPPYAVSVDTDGKERWNWTFVSTFYDVRTVNFFVKDGKVVKPLPVIPDEW